MTADGGDVYGLLVEEPLPVDAEEKVTVITYGNETSILDQPGGKQWSDEIIGACSRAKKVQYHNRKGKVFEGKFISLIRTQKNSEKNNFRVLFENEDLIYYLNLANCERPAVIKDESWWCLYFHFEDGYLSLYF